MAKRAVPSRHIMSNIPIAWTLMTSPAEGATSSSVTVTLDLDGVRKCKDTEHTSTIVFDTNPYAWQTAELHGIETHQSSATPVTVVMETWLDLKTFIPATTLEEFINCLGYGWKKQINPTNQNSVYYSNDSPTSFVDDVMMKRTPFVEKHAASILFRIRFKPAPLHIAMTWCIDVLDAAALKCKTITSDTQVYVSFDHQMVPAYMKFPRRLVLRRDVPSSTSTPVNLARSQQPIQPNYESDYDELGGPPLVRFMHAMKAIAARSSSQSDDSSLIKEQTKTACVELVKSLPTWEWLTTKHLDWNIYRTIINHGDKANFLGILWEELSKWKIDYSKNSSSNPNSNSNRVQRNGGVE
jgi:hypothetical protein